jgi:amidase
LPLKAFLLLAAASLQLLTIWQRPAAELARQLRAGELSAREVVEAFLSRINAINPKVNAIVTLVAERALDAARAADVRRVKGEAVGPLHGLPIAHKDLQLTAGIRTTFGSPIFRDHVPAVDSPLAARLKQAGAIVVGKTNTPEFGAGSQTFNPVFGATLNPYDVTKTCGGSSGGAAVALACGMLPIADGTDMGGSLRNPAAFCGVVGMRPSPPETGAAWESLSVDGPMGRSAADVALLLGALNDQPIPDINRTFSGVRVAWTTTLEGVPFDARVVDVVERARPCFETIGCIVDDAAPNLNAADGTFRTLRAKAFIEKHAATIAQHRSLVKATVLEEIARGEQLTAADVTAAEVERTALRRRVATFMNRYEYFVLPTTQVPPFDVAMPFVAEISGIAMASYIDWMKSCYYISTIGHPAISVPCGFTADGLPIGLQIVGRSGDDWGVLRLAHAYEQARGDFARPPLSRDGHCGLRDRAFRSEGVDLGD